MLSTLKELNEKKQPKPLLLKIVPDLSNDQLLDIIDIVTTVNIDGVIATNTTLNREGLQSHHKARLVGCCKPLTKRSTVVIRFGGEKQQCFPIIGVGGYTPQRMQ